MARSLVLGNGRMLVCFDHNYQIRDFYYPHVGQENHVGTHGHMIGIWVDGKISWINNNDWDLHIGYSKTTLVSHVVAIHNDLGLKICINDVVYNESNIFVRQVEVENLREHEREVRVFFSQEFEIYSVSHGNTAYYDPRESSVIHYKGRRKFLINGMKGKTVGFNDFTCGAAHWKGKEGSYKDADDGVLSRNGIEHGSVDSVIGFNLNVKPGKKEQLFYWITVGETIKEIRELNQYVIKKGPDHLIRTTGDFWHAWVDKQNYNFFDLNDENIELFYKSLLFSRILTNHNGSSIASPDTDILQFGKDTYNYMWPRDTAFNILALDKAGYNQITRKFFLLCKEMLEQEGFLMHKYLPDASLGSSWHPWLRDGEIQYPIQEDETALVIFALEQHYEKSHSVEFIEELYNPVIKKAANFMVDYRDGKYKLPLPTYDLWEERFGVHTFTCCTVYAGLLAAANLAKLLGKTKDCQKYFNAAQEIKKGINKHLYDKEQGYYIRGLYMKDGEYEKDYVMDSSSFYGVLRFQVAGINSAKIKSTFEHVINKLTVKTSSGGIARYQQDYYMAVSNNWEVIPGNPWFLCTLWVADYYIASAKKKADLKPAKEIIDWVTDHSLSSFVLPEQMHPEYAHPISVAPLTWSHSQFVITILYYIKKMAQFEGDVMHRPFHMTQDCD